MRPPVQGSASGWVRRSRVRRCLAIGATLTALVLPIGLLAPAHAATHEPVPVGSAARPDDDRAKSAAKAIEDAEATLEGEKGLDPTLALVQVQQTLDAMSSTDRDRADRLLARPDDGDNLPGEINYQGRTAQVHCTQHFCIHWVKKGKHAPALDDDDDNGVPDYVDLTATEMEHVWSTEVGTLGYRRPVSDGTDGNPDGDDRTGLVDVYLGNTGAQQVYGYAVPEDNTPTSTSYLVLDNDFDEFQGSPVESLKVTAAHEFFHVIQFAYSTRGDGWFMEATATWVEERVHDGINDNRQFVAYSTATRPGQSLDAPTTWYGNWVFFEGLAQKHGPAVVRTAWQKVAAGENSMRAINKALVVRKTSLATEFSRFASGSNAPATFFSEGKHYRRSAVARTSRLGPNHKSTGKKTFRQAHLSSRNLAFKPRSGARAGAKVRLRVTTGSHRARARALVQFKDGTVKRRTINFDKSGVGKARVAFSHAKVKRVVLTLSNVSLRYRCLRGTAFTCQGKPRDDRMAMSYKATFLP